MTRPTTDPSTAPRRQVRADARRNYQRLLVEARAAFTEHGTDASLEGIARRAGVGIGTLYRHFPTREALLEALLSVHFEALRARAGELAPALPPLDALAAWLREFAAHATTYHGLAASVLTALRDERSQLYAACHAMRAAVAQLLARAQQSGAVRADADADDLLAMANAIAWVSERAPHGPDRADRLHRIMIDGLRR